MNISHCEFTKLPLQFRTRPHFSPRHQRVGPTQHETQIHPKFKKHDSLIFSTIQRFQNSPRAQKPSTSTVHSSSFGQSVGQQATEYSP